MDKVQFADHSLAGQHRRIGEQIGVLLSGAMQRDQSAAETGARGLVGHG